MTRTTKTLALCSLASIAVGLTGVYGAIGLPFGAICFGLFMISKVMEKEGARFDEEHRARLGQNGEQPFANSKNVERPVEQPGSHPSLEAHFPAR